MAKKDARTSFGMECTECKSRNYIISRNTAKNKEKIVLKKYCKKCRVVRTHQEYKLK